MIWAKKPTPSTVDRMITVEGGSLELSGQFAMISRTGAAREFLRRFDITEPLAGTDPQSEADAMGRAVTQPSGQIATSIAR